MWKIFERVLIENSLVTAFAVVGITVAVSYFFSDKLTKGRVHGSAIAIFLGLVMAYFAGAFIPGGQKGVADIPVLAGMGIMGGAMLRDFAIVSTAAGVRFAEIRHAGVCGAASLFLGIFASFAIGGIIAWAFGYRDAVSITTIGGGAATYIVGPVTGAALKASSEVIALSLGAGLVKAILVMTCTPFIARWIGLNNPRTAIVFGGLMGTTSGVVGGLAATDPKLVPYGAMTATFYTGLGCFLGPSVIFFLVRLFVV